MKEPVRGIDDNRILTTQQKEFLTAFARSDLRQAFRLTGGTALSAFYLEHRLSEDLDFFSQEKLPIAPVEAFLTSLPGRFDISLAKQFDRNIFTLTDGTENTLKVEFTYYPLRNIEPSVTVGGVQVDSFLDVVVNKLCAVADRSDAKDYVDLYAAATLGGLRLAELFLLAEQKCEIKGIRYVLRHKFLEVPDGIQKLSLNVQLSPKDVQAFFEDRIREMVRTDAEGGERP